MHRTRLFEAIIKDSGNQVFTGLSRLFDDVPFAVALLSGPELRIEYINQYNLTIWEKSREEVIGKPLFEVFPGQRADAEPVHQQVYSTGQRFTVNELPVNLLINGRAQTRWFNSIVEPVRNDEGQVIGQLATTIEVTEQVLARRKIEAEERQLSSLANAMPQLVWIATSEGNVTYYNDRIQEFAGARRLPDGNWVWEGLLHPDDLQHTSDAWNAALARGTVYQTEHRVKMRDGSYRWHLSRAFPYKDSNGKVEKWYGTATDIQEQKQFSEALETLVAERTKALQRSNEDLQQFAHVASHDLKEPVRKIKLFANRLQDEFSEHLPERGKLFLQKIHASADRMFAMIEGVLTYSSANAPEQPLQEVDLNNTIKSIESDLEVIIQSTGTQVIYNGLPVLQGAPVLLYQLFYNLINNSIKFAKSNVAPRITLRATEKLVAGSAFAEIVLADNGIGFDPSYAQAIFETFTRLHPKEQYEGTGLGLSLCKKIVERHHGSIQAIGIPNEGSTFTILLPLKQPV